MNTREATEYSSLFTIADIGQALKRPGAYTDQQHGSGLSILIYTLSGTGTLHMRHHSTVLPPSTCFFLHYEEASYHWSVDTKDCWYYHYITLEETAPQASLASGAFQISPENFLKLFQQFQKYTPERHCAFQHKIDRQLSEMLQTIPRSLYSEVPSSSAQGRDNIMPAIRYIREHYASRITTEKLARECHLSTYYFIHQFKNTFRETPYQYLTRYRIEAAKQLLQDNTRTLQTVALMVGYDTYSNFLTHFKRLTDITPTQYREQFPNAV